MRYYTRRNDTSSTETRNIAFKLRTPGLHDSSIATTCGKRGLGPQHGTTLGIEERFLFLGGEIATHNNHDHTY